MSKYKIIITRSGDRGLDLCSNINKINTYQASLTPTFVINSYQDINNAKVLSKNYDWLIFTSVNAVIYSLDCLVNNLKCLKSKSKIAAIGAGTAEILLKNQLSVDLFPQKFNSEALLSALINDGINDKKILIIRGVGGRRLLATNLAKHGAEVSHLKVYRRDLPDKNIFNHFMDKLLVANLAQLHLIIIICTSASGLINLLELASTDNKLLIQKTQLIVISPKMAIIAKKLGFIKSAWVADDANNKTLIKLLMDFHPAVI